ncbi:MAG: PBP1A family penicillin-binding protein [Myxococcales bacterium]|nr:PBP1A family penicillin-binding protein [Myxococcales bacterium]
MAGRNTSRGRKRAKRKPAEKRGRVLRALRVLGLFLVVVGFISGFAAGRYLLALDREVRARFEGRLFRVPSRVYSAPTVLYPGLDTERTGLRDTLTQLAYRERPAGQVHEPGQFSWSDGRLTMFRRAFSHPSRPEPPREVGIRIIEGEISGMRDLESDREIGAFVLEPVPVGAYFGPDREQRELVRLSEVPRHLIDAILAVEDQRFLEHPGIDLRRVLGAVLVNLRAGKIRQGASTLTQQLVKNFFLTPERSFKRKLNEAAMSLIVEARYDKEAILESYLNEIYLGQRGATAVHGVGEASLHYFGKSPDKLRLSESALIAAIIQSPNGLSPYRQSEAATRRRNLVLRLMYEQARIDTDQLAEASAQDLGLAKLRRDPREARYFLDMLRRQLPEFYDSEVLTSEGLRVYATIDLRIQRIAARVLREELERLEKLIPDAGGEPRPPLQGCLVALRPQTGEVLALVGGRSYADSQYDRCTQARRPSGSVFKPFVYTAALEPASGRPTITLASRLDDHPFEVKSGGQLWKPANYDRSFRGEVDVRSALEQSLNVATARLGNQVGIDRVIDVARRLGIESPLPNVPSLAIGTADLAPIELARAYATLANGGIRPQIRSFEDIVEPDGRTLARQAIDFERVLDAGTAFLTTSLLEGVVNRGTAARLRSMGIDGPVAAKTGTSDDERDAWFAGFTPEMVAVVWIGFDEPRSIGLPASRSALPVWGRFMKEVTGGNVRGAFVPPPDVVQLNVDPLTGHLAEFGCPRSQGEFFLRGTEPVERCGLPSSRAVRRDDAVPNLIERLFRRFLDRL